MNLTNTSYICVVHTCLENTAISSLKDSEEHTSPPATPGSRGVHVANSHFSNISANSGNNGCLHKIKQNISLFILMYIHTRY